MRSTGSGPNATPRASFDSPDLWRAVVGGCPGQLVLVDRDWRVLYANRAPDGGGTARMVGRSAFDLVPVDASDGLSAALHDIFDGAPPSSREERGIGADGAERWSTVHLWGIRLDGAVVAAAIVAHDVTGQRRLANQLRDWQRLNVVGQLSAGIVHDFNNVLTIIGAAAQLVAADTYEDETTRGDVETIQSEVGRGLALTRQLLALTRATPSSGREVDLNVVVRDVAAVVRHAVHGSVEIVESLDPDGTVVYGDRSQMEQVVMNLVLNAREATPTGGTISLMTSRVPMGVRLFVSDNGNGIPDEARARLFEPFYTTRAKSGGTGLGLWIVQTIVSRAGGTIDVLSVPGLGTTFVVTLPPTPGGRGDERLSTPRLTTT